MKISKLQINAFGNLENKEIELSKNINILYGKNEAGKSTLLKFIVDSLYGISKNKRGKEFSDYDRYKPWKTEEFSGKLTYTLDNGKKYEIFRDFNKKNPKIYDEELNDISGTGEDNVSYKKAMEKINKRQVEEIGTLRSQGRPINIIKEEKFKLQDEIGELEEYKEKQYEIEEIKQNLQEKVKQEEEKLKLVKELKLLEEKEKIEKQKIALNESILNENNQKIEKLKHNKKELEVELNKIEILNETKKSEKQDSNKIKNVIGIALITIFAIIAIILRKNILILGISAIASAILLLLLIISNIKLNKKIEAENKKIEKQTSRVKQQRQELETSIDKIDTQIELLIKNSDEQVKVIENVENILKTEIENERNEIKSRYKLEEININNISYELEKIQNNINKNKLEIHSLELDKNNILPKLEKLAEMEEKLEELNEKEENLLKLNNAIELTKQVLEIAYTKMKENVTPKFTKNLSKNIEQISNGKYKKVRINDEEGIIVEKENGEYISSEKLSIRYSRTTIHIIKVRGHKRTIRRNNANNTR